MSGGGVFYYLTLPFLLNGALLALEIAAVAMVGGLILGLLLALVRMSSFRPFSAAAWFYIWFIRGTPQLLQLVFIYDALPSSASRWIPSRPRSSASRSTRLPSAPRSFAVD